MDFCFFRFIFANFSACSATESKRPAIKVWASPLEGALRFFECNASSFCDGSLTCCCEGGTLSLKKVCRCLWDRCGNSKRGTGCFCFVTGEFEIDAVLVMFESLPWAEGVVADPSFVARWFTWECSRLMDLFLAHCIIGMKSKFLRWMQVYITAGFSGSKTPVCYELTLNHGFTVPLADF